MDKKKKILTAARGEFLRYGYKKATVDDISQALGISKKTLYQYFPTKKDLLLAVVKDIQTNIATELKNILRLHENAVVKLFLFSQVIGKQIQNFNEALIRDIQTHHGNIWEEIENFRREIITKNFNKLLKQGKKEGLIIDSPETVVINLLLSSAESVTDKNFILNNNISIQAALRASLEIIINGILTPKGRKLFNKAKKEI